MNRPIFLIAPVVAAFAAAAASASRGDGAFHPCKVTGRTLPDAYVVANSGEITKADRRGDFTITFPSQGVYCLKAMKDGYGECVRPWLMVPEVPFVNLPLKHCPDPSRRVIHGNLGHPAQLTITDSGRPVRGFDLAGNPIGGQDAPKGVWHQRNPFFWTAGEYAFTATGEVRIVESLDFPELRKRGWFKGDFHAHVVHGENFYRVNLQQMNLICRAERYDWIWLSQASANDDVPTDYVALAKYLSDSRLFMRVNMEFPKNSLGHFGDIGVDPLSTADYGDGYSEETVTNLELAERTIYARGGLAVPVHPLYGSGSRIHKPSGCKMYTMLNNELFLWLLCRPDLVPVVDFFYFPEARAEKLWYRLLNRGYTLACSGTSDAAVDLGRTPGASHATYAKLDKVDGESIVRAFRNGRTMVSYRGAAVLFEIDGKTSGDRLLPGEHEHTLAVDCYADPRAELTVRIIRNGCVFRQCDFKMPEDGHFSFSQKLVEREDAWYVAVLKPKGREEIRAAASPVYFRGAEFRPPEVIPMPRPLPKRIMDRIRRLTPVEADTDEWYEELKSLLKTGQADS